MAGAAMMLVSCASSQEWAEWKNHPAHFASGEHFMFSVTTKEGAKQIRRADIVTAREQGWWGTPITVDQSQVLER